MQRSLSKEEISPRLLNLISRDTEWMMKQNGERINEFTEEKKLELRLAPPGEEDWCIKKTIKATKVKSESPLSFGYFPSITPFMPYPSIHQSLSVMRELQNPEKKPFLPASANSAGPKISQKRTAPASVVGWPPIRSCRKNLASSSNSKPSTESQVNCEKPNESCTKGLFVKINMDGIPIGRKVDLNAYDSYEKLSTAVDELFRDLLAAQKDSSVAVIQNEHEDKKMITDVLDGCGEYTLVYEDNEGDRMLVGDVPWHMFAATVKRLRVLKSSELSSLSLRRNKQDKISTSLCMKNEEKSEFSLEFKPKGI